MPRCASRTLHSSAQQALVATRGAALGCEEAGLKAIGNCCELHDVAKVIEPIR